MGTLQQALMAIGTPAPSGPALVQQKTDTSASGSIDAVFDTLPMAGNSVIACISYLSTDTIAGSPTFDSNAMTQAATATVAGVKVDIWYIHNISSPAGELLYDTNSGFRTSVSVSEWSGLANAGPADTDTNSGVASATATTNSVTPGSLANLLIAIGGWIADDYLSGPINSWTRLTPTGGGAAWQEAAYKIQSSAAAGSTGWGLTAGINWCAAIAAFNGT